MCWLDLTPGPFQNLRVPGPRAPCGSHGVLIMALGAGTVGKKKALKALQSSCVVGAGQSRGVCSVFTLFHAVLQRQRAPGFAVGFRAESWLWADSIR